VQTNKPIFQVSHHMPLCLWTAARGWSGLCRRLSGVGSRGLCTCRQCRSCPCCNLHRWRWCQHGQQGRSRCQVRSGPQDSRGICCTCTHCCLAHSCLGHSLQGTVGCQRPAAAGDYREPANQCLLHG
jgi:hypothetical protein